MSETMRTCRICRIEKPITEFYKRPDIRSGGYRTECKICINRHGKEWRCANRRRITLRNQKYYQLNKHRIGIKERGRNKELKYRVIAYYSHGTMKCKCGYSDIDVLCIDHINNDGKQERVKLNIGSGIEFYVRLVKNNYPDGYQVLCANCNHRKHLEYLRSKHINTKSAIKSRICKVKVKFRVLSHYSEGVPKCKCCSESDIDVLCIDHINGGGGEERRCLNIKPGIEFYWHLIRNGYPKGYQVLCFNCNLKKLFSFYTTECL